ncbi:MAG: hypothetical protein NC213_08240 [Acetobacter sp.]|nr:hypothetical protein [Bacteroides sp.]MCM1341718.1 hypothetical protein [Acetobacter sp.]MCM1432343.1 hypothetical protein [Clostridiales bacterium]
MYCKNCGQVIPDGYSYCPCCQTKADNHTTQDGTYFTPNTDQENCQHGAYQQNNGYTQNTQENFFNQGNNQYGFNQQAQYYADAARNLDDAKTLGILAIILGILFSPIVGIICGIIGLSKANSVADMPETFDKKAKAKRLNSLGIAIPIVLWVFAAIVMILVFTFVIGATGIAGSVF